MADASNVTMIRSDFQKNLPKVLDKFGLGEFKGKSVLIKLHMGELQNRWYVEPSLVKIIVDSLKGVGAKPILFDTVVVYPSLRAFKKGHMIVAKKHGFTKLCRVVIGDEGEKVEAEGLKFEIAKGVTDHEYMIVVSHAKGHGGAGYGGAIKNVGMGCVSKKCKTFVHSEMSVPCVDKNKCVLCGKCEKVCEQHAIKVENQWKIKVGLCVGCGECIKNCPNKALDYKKESLNHMLAYASKAATKHMKKIIYVNVLLKMTKECDCVKNALPIICDDIGVAVSDDMVAVDKASIDLMEKKMGKTFKDIHDVDPIEQITTAEKIGIGKSKYNLTTVKG